MYSTMYYKKTHLQGSMDSNLFLHVLFHKSLVFLQTCFLASPTSAPFCCYMSYSLTVSLLHMSKLCQSGNFDSNIKHELHPRQTRSILIWSILAKNNEKKVIFSFIRYYQAEKAQAESAQVATKAVWTCLVL